MMVGLAVIALVRRGIVWVGEMRPLSVAYRQRAQTLFELTDDVGGGSRDAL